MTLAALGLVGPRFAQSRSRRRPVSTCSRRAWRRSLLAAGSPMRKARGPGAGLAGPRSHDGTEELQSRGRVPQARASLPRSLAPVRSGEGCRAAARMVRVGRPHDRRAGRRRAVAQGAAGAAARRHRHPRRRLRPLGVPRRTANPARCLRHAHRPLRPLPRRLDGVVAGLDTFSRIGAAACRGHRRDRARRRRDHRPPARAPRAPLPLPAAGRRGADSGRDDGAGAAGTGVLPRRHRVRSVAARTLGADPRGAALARDRRARRLRPLADGGGAGGAGGREPGGRRRADRDGRVRRRGLDFRGRRRRSATPSASPSPHSSPFSSCWRHCCPSCWRRSRDPCRRSAPAPWRP